MVIDRIADGAGFLVTGRPSALPFSVPSAACWVDCWACGTLLPGCGTVCPTKAPASVCAWGVEIGVRLRPCVSDGHIADLCSPGEARPEIVQDGSDGQGEGNENLSVRCPGLIFPSSPLFFLYFSFFSISFSFFFIPLLSPFLSYPLFLFLFYLSFSYFFFFYLLFFFSIKIIFYILY